MTTNTKKEYTLDASGKKLGRFATEIAVILMGKNTPAFEKNVLADVKVSVINASKMDITDKKSKTQTYRHYTGSRGGLREQTLGEIVAKSGYSEVLEKTVAGMIHNNKLKSKRLLNLTISE